MKVIYGAALAMTVALAGLPAAAGAHSGDQLGRYHAATVDGTMSATEYGSSCLGPDSRSSGTKTYNVTLCETNDDTTAYWGVHVTNASGANPLRLLFDDDHDGVVAKSAGVSCAPAPSPIEDALSLSELAPGEVIDTFYCEAGGQFAWGFGDGIEQATGLCKGDGAGGQVCELSHPLDSGDGDDMAVHPGATFGVCLTYDDASNPADPYGSFGGDLEVPDRCAVDKTQHLGAVNGSAAHYADVRVAGATDGILATLASRPTTPVAGCRWCPPPPVGTTSGQPVEAR